jgi:spectinomycin phosphotransferase
LLEKPNIPDDRITACLRDAYGLAIAEIAFLPLGVDVNAAVYRAVADDGAPPALEQSPEADSAPGDRFTGDCRGAKGAAYFVKLRGGPWDDVAVALPRFLRDQGIERIIAPLTTRTGHLWAGLDPFKLILYPFVEGRDGYEVDLPDRCWIEFGAALRHIHTVGLPPVLRSSIPHETYSPQGRETVRTFLDRIETDAFDEPVAAKMAAFLRTQRGKVLDLVARAEELAQALQDRPPAFTLCHADLHAGNLLIAADAFYLVDWDAPLLAPKEHDLMAIGGGLMGGWRTPEEEERRFYQGYGPTQVDPAAMAYYRYERIVQDISAFCKEIFLTTEGGRDREQALEYLMSSFRPAGVLEIALRSDRTPTGIIRRNP